MHICYLGALDNVHTRRWVTYFAKIGHKVTVISTTESKDFDNESLTINFIRFYIPRFGFYKLNLILLLLLWPLYLFRLKAIVKNINPEILHVHYINDLAFLAILIGIKNVILTAWGSDILVSPQKSLIRKWVVGFTMRKAKLVTCDAEHMKSAIVQFGVAPEKVKIIFFGSDVKKFNPDKRNELAHVKYSGTKKKIIVSFRNLEPIYDIPTFIRAIPLINKKFPEAFHFLIGGSGSLDHELKKLVQTLGIQNLTFTGRIAPDALPEFLASADFYVSTALSDGGIAASTAEAMACEVPVIISDVGDNAQWIQSKINGMLFRPQSEQDLTQAISELYTDSELYKQCAQKGRIKIVSENNLYVEMSKMNDLYLKL